MHPQTLLCYEMNGNTLPQEHGVPLRLVIPVKYGVKNLKRIGKNFLPIQPPEIIGTSWVTTTMSLFSK